MRNGYALAHRILIREISARQDAVDHNDRLGLRRCPPVQESGREAAVFPSCGGSPDRSNSRPRAESPPWTQAGAGQSRRGRSCPVGSREPAPSDPPPPHPEFRRMRCSNCDTRRRALEGAPSHRRRKSHLESDDVPRLETGIHRPQIVDRAEKQAAASQKNQSQRDLHNYQDTLSALMAARRRRARLP